MGLVVLTGTQLIPPFGVTVCIHGTIKLSAETLKLVSINAIKSKYFIDFLLVSTENEKLPANASPIMC